MLPHDRFCRTSQKASPHAGVCSPHLRQQSSTVSTLQQPVVTHFQVQVLVLVQLSVRLGGNAQSQRHEHQDGGSMDTLHTCKNMGRTRCSVKNWEIKNRPKIKKDNTGTGTVGGRVLLAVGYWWWSGLFPCPAVVLNP